MADLTCNSRVLEGIFRGSSAIISTNDDDFKGIVQGYSISFEVPRKQLYDLVTSGFYYIEYPPIGLATFQKVVGPKGFQKNICSCVPKTITLDATGASCYPDGALPAQASYVLVNALPSKIDITSNVQDWIIVFSVSYVFSDLQ